tara:strand:- start:1288 stop:1554 length:267 start_codon:yes stop_codon:yes gene_type:complete
MALAQDPYSNLRSFLDQMTWPCVYTFKFIGKEEDIRRIQYLFESADISFRHTKNKKYTGFTAKMMMVNSESVINIYKDVSQIKGIIAL